MELIQRRVTCRMRTGRGTGSAAILSPVEDATDDDFAPPGLIPDDEAGLTSTHRNLALAVHHLSAGKRIGSKLFEGVEYRAGSRFGGARRALCQPVNLPPDIESRLSGEADPQRRAFSFSCR